MAFATGPRAFTRAGVEEEEITPPCLKTARSFDTLSVAQMLCGQADEEAAVSSPEAAKLTVATDALTSIAQPDRATASPTATPTLNAALPDSPSIARAAAALSTVQRQPSGGALVGAADTLMALAALSGEMPSAPPPPSGTKRGRAADANGETGPTKRRLKMRANGQQQGGARARAAAARAAQQQQQQRAAQSAAAVDDGTLRVPGVMYPVTLLSGASLQQLKLLAAAFQLCPCPTPAQLQAIANRVALSAEKLETWFQSRRTLQEWVVQQPQMQASDLAGMFYAQGDMDMGPMFAVNA